MIRAVILQYIVVVFLSDKSDRSSLMREVTPLSSCPWNETPRLHEHDVIESAEVYQGNSFTVTINDSIEISDSPEYYDQMKREMRVSKKDEMEICESVSTASVLVTTDKSDTTKIDVRFGDCIGSKNHVHIHKHVHKHKHNHHHKHKHKKNTKSKKHKERVYSSRTCTKSKECSAATHENFSINEGQVDTRSLVNDHVSSPSVEQMKTELKELEMLIKEQEEQLLSLDNEKKG